ncbi:hypothetical protein PENTCL1PPCAC_23515 [Pristionchus entomophagus]|uniref:G protein-coupled receptor n=1 Tax=Pristionchus entomophagus TaxID=358040 RepID=A0AAV5U4D8_9BILA|nr:hypothetical protein PENTCL1PPCAC_23515 [Pristionchus entomophagus]
MRISVSVMRDSQVECGGTREQEKGRSPTEYLTVPNRPIISILGSMWRRFILIHRPKYLFKYCPRVSLLSICSILLPSPPLKSLDEFHSYLSRDYLLQMLALLFFSILPCSLRSISI